MTAKEKRQQVLTLIDQWQVQLGLGGWLLRCHFPAKIKEIASCKAQPEYLTADLYWNLKRLPDTDLELRELVAHELLHCHVEELASLATKAANRGPERKEAIRQAEERLVTTVSRVLLPHLP